jgi:type IV secretory pathway VirB3-like protein
MGSFTRVGAYLVLCRLLQMVLSLSNREFLLLFCIWAVIIFIVTWLTHTHDVDAGEVAMKWIDKVGDVVQKIQSWTPSTDKEQIAQPVIDTNKSWPTPSQQPV